MSLRFQLATAIAVEIYDARKHFARPVVRLVVAANQLEPFFIRKLDLGTFYFEGFFAKHCWACGYVCYYPRLIFCTLLLAAV